MGVIWLLVEPFDSRSVCIYANHCDEALLWIWWLIKANGGARSHI